MSAIDYAIESMFFGDTAAQSARAAALEAAATLTNIARQRERGDISEKEAADLVEAQRDASLVVMATVEGMREVDKAVAFDALKSLIVKAAGAAI